MMIRGFIAAENRIRLNRKFLVEKSRLLFLLAGLWMFFTVSAPAFAGEDVPAWLKQAAATGTPSYGKNVPAAVLFNEGVYRVDDAGKVTRTLRYAVKILKPEGRKEARGIVLYDTDFEKIKEMRGWLIRPSEEVKKYGKDETLEGTSIDDVFSESKKKIITAADEAEPGSVFGYEYTVEERGVFTQLEWYFQSDLPVTVSRFMITLPSGWRAEGVTFNHSKVEPVINDSTYTWEMRDLAFIENEPSSPPPTTIAPRLAVSYYPAAGKTIPGKSFSSWAEVSRWLFELSDAQAIISEPLAAKARELTARAKTEFEKIQAIGQFVQGVNYVSIQTGVGRGGGYRPHSSVDVFAKSYGDCKDKANLMRAMLKAIGITSYLVSIYSGDPTYVREEWPSPQQFNHCIIAVKVSEQTQAATVIKHATLGRLLIFDPTDDNTPVGDLPGHEQNSFALIEANEGGSLERMPTTPPEMNRLERQVEASLSLDGSLTAKITEQTIGQEAADYRREFRGFSRADYVKMIERWITHGATGASVTKVEPADNGAEGKFTLNVEFSAPRYAQSMQGRLLVFKPAIVSRRDALFLTNESRQHPVMLETQVYTEIVRVKLPDGFEVDEMPDPVKLDTPVGTYSTSYEVKDGILQFKRSMVVRGGMIPASEYDKVRQFFLAMRTAEQTPVVLAKK